MLICLSISHVLCDAVTRTPQVNHEGFCAEYLQPFPQHHRLYLWVIKRNKCIYSRLWHEQFIMSWCIPNRHVLSFIVQSAFIWPSVGRNKMDHDNRGSPLIQCMKNILLHKGCSFITQEISNYVSFKYQPCLIWLS